LAGGNAVADPFNSPESLLGVAPSSVRLKNAGKWNAVAFSEVNKVMAEKAVGQPAAFRVKVEAVEPHTGGGHAFCLRYNGRALVQGAAIAVKLFAYFDEDQGDALRPVRIGQTVTVTGTVNKAALDLANKDPRFFIDLVKCTI